MIEDEDLIPKQNIVITLTHKGYIKRLPIDTYRSQKRGGRGIQGMGTNDGDFVEHLFTTLTHNTILFFTNKGKVYRLKGYEVPELSRTAKGIPIINLLQIEKDEYITAIIPIEEFVDDWFVFFATKQGVVKRSPLSAFANIRKGGLIAINFKEDDELMGVRLTNGSKELIMGTKQGMAIRFHEEDVRSMGRTATGVKGIALQENDQVVGIGILDENQDVLIVTDKGFGKRTPVQEYRVQTRGGKGIKTCNLTERNGVLTALKTVTLEEECMIITESGVIIRIDVQDISQTGRNTQGVRLIRISEGDSVATVAKVEINEEGIEGEDIEDTEATNEVSGEEIIDVEAEEVSEEVSEDDGNDDSTTEEE